MNSRLWSLGLALSLSFLFLSQVNATIVTRRDFSHFTKEVLSFMKQNHCRESRTVFFWDIDKTLIYKTYDEEGQKHYHLRDRRLPAIFNYFHKKTKIKMSGLTARSRRTDVVNRTIGILKSPSIGLSFLRPYKMHQHPTPFFDIFLYYKEGVYFSGRENKGIAIRKIMESRKVDCFVFIDDKEFRIRDVNNAFKNQKEIPYLLYFTLFPSSPQ